MNAIAHARNGYSATSLPVQTPKGIEYAAISRITREIVSAERGGLESFPRLATALRDNKRLWTIFAASVADPENALPAELKARLFYLAEFTFAHTSDVLARRAPATPLVEINTEIMRGLSETRSAA